MGKGGLAGKPLLRESYDTAEPRVAHFGQLHVTWCQEGYMAGEDGLAGKPLLLHAYGPSVLKSG